MSCNKYNVVLSGYPSLPMVVLTPEGKYTWEQVRREIISWYVGEAEHWLNLTEEEYLEVPF